MTAAQGISKYGFRSWYERELILSHSYLVTSVLSLVLALVLYENLDLRGPVPSSLGSLVVIAGAVVVSGAALRRYLHMLGSAVALAENCVCAQCGTYGIVRVIASGRTEYDADPQWMRLCCKKCGHEWPVESG